MGLGLVVWGVGGLFYCLCLCLCFCFMFLFFCLVSLLSPRNVD